MIHEIPLMRSMDPHHARLGYLGVCAAVGVRSLDTYEALVSRMRDLLYERFYPGDPAFDRAMALAEPTAIQELITNRTAEEDPTSILAPLNTRSHWLTRGESWLYDSRLPSHLGYLKPSHVGRAVDLARWTGVLLPTLDLSEDGLLLQLLVKDGGELDWRDVNPLLVTRRPALVLTYMRLLLRAEILFVPLLCEMAARTTGGQPMGTRGKDGLLRHAVARLQKAVGEPTDPEDFLAFRTLGEFQETFLKTLSTEENYFRPRIEILVDLGLVDRKPATGADKPGTFPWTISLAGRQIAAAWADLDRFPLRIDEFLETEFVGSMESVLGRSLRACSGPDEALAWFADGYKLVHREIGFTPGRTVATMASLLAAERGVRLELAELYSTLYAVPKGSYAEYVSFSGGSRFDAEFMIKLNPTLFTILPSTSDLSTGV